jgi:hypothetical protein
VYEKFFRWLGHGEAIDPMIEAWNAGDRAKALELAPRDLVEEVFILGDAAAQKERLEAFVAAGVDVPMILGVPLAEPTPDAHVALVESLAPSG